MTQQEIQTIIELIEEIRFLIGLGIFIISSLLLVIIYAIIAYNSFNNTNK